MTRLRRKADLQRTFREGRRFYSPWAVLQARLRRTGERVAPGPRLAVVAGKRFRNAVTRNRARRLLRETYRASVADGMGDWDLVAIARPEILNVRFLELSAATADLLRQARALRGKAPTCA